MRSLEDLQEDYDAACAAEDMARRSGYVSAAIMFRRDAAERLLHAAEDPWNDCQCFTCADPGS